MAEVSALTNVINKPIRERKWQINEKTMTNSGWQWFLTTTVNDNKVFTAISRSTGVLQSCDSGSMLTKHQVTTTPRSKYDSYSFFTGPLTFQWGHSSSQDLIHQQDVAGNHRAVRENRGLLKLMTKTKITSTSSECQNLPWMEKLFLDAVIVPHTCFSCHHRLSWKSQKQRNFFFTNFTCVVAEKKEF